MLSSRVILMSCALFVSAFVQAQESGIAYDCSQVELGSIDPDLLTQAERVALLDDSLNESIDAFTRCMDGAQEQAAEAVGASGGAGGGGDAESGEGSGSSSANGESEEAGEEAQAEGVEGEVSAEAQEALAKQAQAQENTQEQQSQEQTRRTKTRKSKGGKKNEIIAPKDNDQILCVSLYDAIQSETDAEQKESLIQQYKDYGCNE